MRKLLYLTLSLIAIHVAAQKTYLHCGTLVDVKKLSLLNEVTIIIDGNKIIDIQKGYVAGSANDKIIDLKKQTVMPGLIDMHVHLEEETGPNRYLNGFTLNDADIAFQAAVYAERTLMSGFTAIRDLGGRGVNISLRNAINNNLTKGPRIYTAGKAIASTGGHADPTNNYRKEIMGDPGPKEGVVNGPEDAAKAVRQRYKDGSDLIKITATGGVLSMAKDGSGAQFTEEEIKAIVTTAKDYGFKVAAHAHVAEGMKRAVLGGVSSIEHGTYMTEEVMDLMKQKGTYLVPTIIAGKSSADSAKKPGYYPEIVRAKALVVGNFIQATFAKAYKRGVKIAFGTDAGVYSHGKNWMEFIYMTEAGMPILEAIQCATLNAADLLGDDRIGIIEKDKLADIIAVDGDPTKDITSMSRVKFVMKNGTVYKNN
ncbi:MAG: amidohydrolase family protein [Sediminibacterium sp.]|nr:amidohydrolase family protein [Sediminibacterium sp.]MBX9779910.1 amidohydrolase family protein [Chitinophagaceae bacterium]